MLLGLVLAAGAGPASAGDAAPTSRAEKPEWTLRLELPAPGAKAAVVHLAARAGFHVNLEYPITFRPAPGAAGGAAKLALSPATKAPCKESPKDACAITLELPLPAGDAPVEGTLAFSVCTAERCLIEKVALSSAGAGRG